MAKITYADKVALNVNPGVAAINKVQDSDMNEIKTVVNGLDDAITNGETYSTSETLTNKTWKDGKPIYRKYLEIPVSSTGTYTYTHNIGIDTVTNISAICTIAGQTPSSHGYRPMPQCVLSTGAWFGINAITTNGISFLTSVWENNKAYITLEYTKTS